VPNAVDEGSGLSGYVTEAKLVLIDRGATVTLPEAARDAGEDRVGIIAGCVDRAVCDVAEVIEFGRAPEHNVKKFALPSNRILDDGLALGGLPEVTTNDAL
jgi:hypothetical protein